jgi:ABC-type uncharacterized transport system YnjBCD substrate-binding protein
MEVNVRAFYLSRCSCFHLVALIVPRVSDAQITAELIDAAKKEGEVMFYGAITINSSKAIGDLFEKKYGIKLRHWRGDATELINRALAEARAGKPAFDVTLGTSRDDDSRRKVFLQRSIRRRRKGIPSSFSTPTIE